MGDQVIYNVELFKHQNVCKICDKSFEKLAVLQRHVKNVHKVLPDYKQPSKVCPTCGVKCRTRDFLRSHVETEHGVKQEIQSLSFGTEQEFLTWKAAEEDAKCSSFIKVRGTPARPANADSNLNYNIYYKCNRDGCYESTATKRHKKSQGTSKIQANCTAGLAVRYHATGGLQVRYYSTHYGHDMEPGHIRIPESGRKTILEELKHKTPHLDILDAIRSRAEKADHLSRIHLTTRKDLRNISAAAGLYEEYKLHKDDPTSVKMWINRYKTLGEDNPILYYKEQGVIDSLYPMLKKEDVVIMIQTKAQGKMFRKLCNDTDTPEGDKHEGLVCLDSTHGTGYDTQLTTIMSADESGYGCPVAHLISSSVNTVTLEVFFTILKNKNGPVSCSVFMSDDFPAFANAWGAVMNKEFKKFLCTWHVDKNWKEKLNMSSEHGQELYKKLKSLQREADCVVFEAALAGFVVQLQEDDRSKNFSSYFQKYVKTKKEWAFCYRREDIDVIINTNMYLESFHKTYKHGYNEGKFIKRLDKALFLLMKLIRDKDFDFMIRKSKNAPSTRIKEIQSRHRTSYKISKEDIEKIGDNMWVVKSQSCDGYYTVDNKSKTCKRTACKLLCDLCQICVHMYSCNCIDSLVVIGLCKHIHAVVRECGLPPGTSALAEPGLLDFSNANNMLDYNSVKETVVCPSSKEIKIATYISELSFLLTQAKTNFQHLSEEQVTSLLADMQINQKKVVEEAVKELPSTSQDPPSSASTRINIEPQVRNFISTKKKRSSKKLSLKRPNIVESSQLVSEMLALQPSNPGLLDPFETESDITDNITSDQD